MSCHCSPGPGAVSSAPGCSDGNQLDISSGTNTASKSSRRGSRTASSMKPRSSGILTISSSPVPLKNTRAMSMWLRQAFPANHSALQERKKAKTTKGISGRKRSNVFAMFDPDTHSWKTSQVCLVLGTSAKSSLRWPKQGLMRDGVCSELTMSVPRTDVKGSGSRLPAKTPSAADAYTGNMKKDEFRFGNSGSLAQEVESGFLETHRKWPTPQARDYKDTLNSRPNKQEHLLDRVRQKMWPTPNTMDSMKGRTPEELKKQATYNKGKWGPKLQTGNLRDAVMWPTPTKSDHKGSGPTMVRKDGKLRGDRLDYATERNSDGSPTGGQLNPNWVEWLIGWPIGWTDLKPLAMDKYQQWLQQHGRS